MKKMIASLVAAGSVMGLAALPVSACAQNWSHAYQHRQDTKNTWRNLAYGSGALGLIGLLDHNSTLTALGVGGAAYSAYRYEQDRKSQNNLARQRAMLFSRSAFDYHGHRYVRKSYRSHGQKYYKFVRVH